jgi:hypothetical protein
MEDAALLANIGGMSCRVFILVRVALAFGHGCVWRICEVIDVLIKIAINILGIALALHKILRSSDDAPTNPRVPSQPWACGCFGYNTLVHCFQKENRIDMRKVLRYRGDYRGVMVAQVGLLPTLVVPVQFLRDSCSLTAKTPT